mgnify:CR=1 FL=1
MEVSKEELLHIANLADLNLKDEEIDSYLENLQEILDFAQTVSSAQINDLDETIGATENVNVFRKDEIVEFGDRDILLQNAPEQEEGMFRIPKVI